MSTVLLASGGLDSSLIAALEAGRIALHLFVDYGQANAVHEYAAANAIAKHHNVEFCPLSMPHIFRGSSLTGSGESTTGPATIVPGRNGFLISTAITVAMTRGLDRVLIGCNATDSAVYPDCRADFLVTTAAAAAAAYGVRVIAPLLTHDKTQIGVDCRTYDVPVKLTRSCYTGHADPCGTCGACETRREVLDVHNHAQL